MDGDQLDKWRRWEGFTFSRMLRPIGRSGGSAGGGETVIS